MPDTTARTWFGTLSTNSLILACGIATGILAARLLLPEGRGALAAVLFWPQLVAGIGIFSLHEATTFRISQANANKERVVSTALYLALILSVVTATIAYFLLPYLLRPERAALVPLARTYLILFLPLNFVALSLLAVDHGQLHFVRYNVFRLISPLTYLLGLTTLWILDAITVESAVWANLCATLAATVLRVMFAPRGLFGRPSWKEAQLLISIGLHFHVTAVLLVIGTQVDRLVVITLLDNVSVGLYMAAFTVASSGLGIITTTFHTIMFPTIARRDTSSAKQTYLAQGLRYAMVLTVTTTIPIMVFSPWLVPFLFGREFSAAITTAFILLVAYIPMAMRQIIVRSVRGLGESRPGTIAEALTLAIFLAASWPLANTLGLIGVGLALLIANTTSLLYLSVYLNTRLSLAPRDWWGINGRTLRELWQKGRILFSQ